MRHLPLRFFAEHRLDIVQTLGILEFLTVHRQEYTELAFLTTSDVECFVSPYPSLPIAWVVGGQTGLYRMVVRMESHPAIGLQAIQRPYQKRTKYRQMYRYLPLLTLSNLFRVNNRWMDGDRVRMALYR